MESIEKKNTGKIVGGIVCGLIIAAMCIVGFTVDAKGVTLNGNHFKLHELKGYKDVVESSIKPVVFMSNDDLNSHFKGVLTDEYQFNVNDIGKAVNLNYKYVYDDDDLYNALVSVNESSIKSENAYIDVETESVVPEVYGTQFDVDSVMKSVKTGHQVDLSDFYIKPEIVKEDLQYDIDFLNDYRAWHVKYFDSAIEITVPKEFITIDKNGVVRASEPTFIDDYLDSIYYEFTTLGVSHEFVNHDGDTVLVEGGTFGNVVDINAEKEALTQMFMSKVSEEGRVPEYEIDMGGLDNKYVEVSISEQHVWFYENGEVTMDADCVTGCVAVHNDTPKGWWYVDSMKEDAWLRPAGATVSSHVDKWMRFTKDGCGLHDASWRHGLFGSDYYLTNGSHGCVNLPKDFAYDLYDKAYVGMPVIVY